jgi:nucleoside-diphosphate-sugar epimerase
MRVDLASKRVLITGIDSFTGGHLSSYLKELGYELFGTSLSRNSKNIYRCDITNRDDILDVLQRARPNFVIHLSAIASPAYGDNSDFYRVNTIGATNLLDTLVELEMTPQKIILVSSATIYGNQGVEVLDESLCPKPANHYGASKYAMESLAKSYFDKLNIIITRPFNYTGIGQTEQFLIPKIVKHFREEKRVIELGNLNVSREFNDIEFVCEVYNRLLSSTQNGEMVNICSGRGVKLLDVIEIMNTIAGYQIEVKVNLAFVRKDEIERLTGSPKKLFNLIGEVEQREFRETLRMMFEA